MRPLSDEQIQLLLKSLALTRDSEIDCGDCQRDLAEFAEAELRGVTIADGLRAVEHHLAICSECCEEYEALLRVLKEARTDSSD